MNPSRITIKTSRGIEVLNTEDILYCSAHGRYSTIVTTNGKEYLLTKILKEIEGGLPYKDFFRTHKSYLINLNHITNYQNNHEKPITLTNEIRIDLAKRRKQDFHKRLKELAPTI